MEPQQLEGTRAQDRSPWPLPLPGHQYSATPSSATEEAASHHLHSHRTFDPRAWFVLRDAWPRSSTRDLADHHAHRQAGQAPEFLLWHTGSSSCFNVVFQEALQILLPPEASAGHKHWAKIAMSDRSRMLRALTQEGRCVAVRLGLPPFSEAGSRFPILRTLLDHPPAQRVVAHNLLHSAPSLIPPSCGHTPSIAPESLRPADSSSLSPLSLLTREGQRRSHLVRPLVEKHRARSPARRLHSGSRKGINKYHPAGVNTGFSSGWLGQRSAHLDHHRSYHGIKGPEKRIHS